MNNWKNMKTKEYYTNRRNEILKMIRKGFRFQYIADKYGVTKQRINQIAHSNKIYRWRNKRKEDKKLIKKIHEYIQNNPFVIYEDLQIKFNLTVSNLNLLRYRHGLNLSNSNLLENRNKNIINDYFNNKLSATEIINKNYGIKTHNAIYGICYSTNRYRKLRTKYNLKNKHFEKKEIFDLIFDLRNNKKMTFQKITKYLNDKNYKTIYGREFKSPNVIYKYKKSKELLK